MENRLTAILYLEDLQLHDKETIGKWVVTKDDIIEFANKFDPQPFHIDEEAAKSSVHGGLVSPSSFTMAVSHSFGPQFKPGTAWMAVLGWQDVEFPNPVRPGDVLFQTIKIIEKRESRSKPDRGIICMATEMKNQRGETVLTYKAKAMVAKRPN